MCHFMRRSYERKIKLGIHQLFCKTFTKWAITIWSYMAFKSKRARLWSMCMHSLPERGHTAHMRSTWDRNQWCGWGFFSIVATKKTFSIFQVLKQVFLWNRVQGAWNRVTGNPCITIEEHLRNAFHTPDAHTNSPRRRRMPHRLPLMSLETDRIWARRPLFPAPIFLEKTFLAPKRVNLCAHFFRFRSSPNRSTVALNAAKRDVRYVPFWAQLIKKQRKMRHLRGAIFCPHLLGKIQNWNTTAILEKTFMKWAITYEVIWLLGQTG
jgi:hypothetical protein